MATNFLQCLFDGMKKLVPKNNNTHKKTFLRIKYLKIHNIQKNKNASVKKKKRAKVLLRHQALN